MESIKVTPDTVIDVTTITDTLHYHSPSKDDIVILLGRVFPKVKLWSDVYDADYQFTYYDPFKGINLTFDVTHYLTNIVVKVSRKPSNSVVGIPPLGPLPTVLDLSTITNTDVPGDWYTVINYSDYESGEFTEMSVIQAVLDSINSETGSNLLLEDVVVTTIPPGDTPIKFSLEPSESGSGKSAGVLNVNVEPVGFPEPPPEGTPEL